MCPLRRVADEEAGPAALGLLVPPGKRTFLILRPRSLAWDLLLVQAPGSPVFRQLSGGEAPLVAQKIYRALEQCGTGGAAALHPVEPTTGPGFWLQASLGAFALLACARRPGQPYQPHVFPDAETAHAAAAALAVVLCPPAGVEQEVYFNTRHFIS
jgi:hypothetical protein